MPITPNQSKAIQRLIEAGIVPANCTRWKLISDVNDVIRARMEILVDEPTLQKIADALIENEEEAKQIVRDVLVKTDRKLRDVKVKDV